jgi:hypothetical protein
LFGGQCSNILYRYSFDPVSATDVEAMVFMWHNGGRVVMGVYLTLLGPHDYYVNLNDYCGNQHGLLLHQQLMFSTELFAKVEAKKQE